MRVGKEKEEKNILNRKKRNSRGPIITHGHHKLSSTLFLPSSSMKYKWLIQSLPDALLPDSSTSTLCYCMLCMPCELCHFCGTK